MAEIKKAPVYSVDGEGDDLWTFTSSHTIKDALRWLLNQSGDGEDLPFLLHEVLEEETAA